MSKEDQGLTVSHKNAQWFDRRWLKRVDLVEKVFVNGFYVFFVLVLITRDSNRNILTSDPFLFFGVCYCIFATFNLGLSLVLWFREKLIGKAHPPAAPDSAGHGNAQR